MAAISNKRFDLIPKIIEMSVGDTWQEAVKEWTLDDIETLDAGEFGTCLCTHYPIRDLCHIRNKENGNVAIVGNKCVEKFDQEDLPESLRTVSSVFQSAKRLRQSVGNSANESLVNFAFSKKAISRWEKNFYLSIWKKRGLSTRQLNTKTKINQKILYEVVLSVRAAYQRLKTQTFEGTAGPKLIRYAYKKGAIRLRDRDFYMKNWLGTKTELSRPQQRYKEKLNLQIVRRLADDLDSSVARAVDRQGAEAPSSGESRLE